MRTAVERDGLSQSGWFRAIFLQMRSTGAGFWPSAENVPIRPNAMVNAARRSVAASAGRGSQMNDRFITSVMTSQAASEPAATPTIAVASPISRYSSA